jgi:hypothetical protein
MKPGKLILYSLLILSFVFFVLMNNTQTDVEGSFYKIYHLYQENVIISAIYKISTYLDLILIVLLILKLFSSIKEYNSLNNYLSYLILIICFVSVFLYWFELYYGSTFYYGEVRDKQALYICTINHGLIGSILFSIIILKILLNKFVKTKNKKIVLLNLSILIILLHFAVYKLLETPWNLWQS